MKDDNDVRELLFPKHIRMPVLAKRSGIARSTLYTRRERPGTLTLDELAGIAAVLRLSPEDIGRIVTERR